VERGSEGTGREVKGEGWVWKRGEDGRGGEDWGLISHIC